MSGQLPPGYDESDMDHGSPHIPAPDRLRTAARLLLASSLVAAGIGHLTVARHEFQAQVPRWVPLDADHVVLASGVVEVALGAAVATSRRHRRLVGRMAAVFFAAIFPGNVAQWRERRDGLGLNSDRKRALRLLGQPVLIAWALWATKRG